MMRHDYNDLLMNDAMNSTNEISRLRNAIIFMAILICIPFLLKLLYALPLKDSYLWYCGIFASFYILGNLIIRPFVFRNNAFLPRLFYSLALGTAFMPIIYTIFRILHLPILIFYFVIGLSLVWIVLSLKDFKIAANYDISLKDVISFGILI